MDYDALFLQIHTRNEIQTEPYSEIYRSSYALWQKYTQLDSHREELRHQLALIEHEGADYINKGDLQQAISTFKKGLEGLQVYHNRSDETKSSVPLTNLSKTIYDQKKRLANQKEELELVKSELKTSIERNVDLDSELLRLTKELNELKRLSHLPPPPSSST